MDLLILLKKQLKEDIYRTGIYKISFTNNDYFYIGLASRVNKFNCYSGFYNRWSRHLNDLKKNKHVNLFLQRVYNKYGENVLKFEILEFCTQENISKKEMDWFEKLKPPMNFQGNKEYVKPECKPKKPKSFIRKPHSDSTKLKMSVAAINRACINRKKSIRSIRRKSRKNLIELLLFMRKEKTSITHTLKLFKFSKKSTERDLKYYNLYDNMCFYNKINNSLISNKVGKSNSKYTNETIKKIPNILEMYNSLNSISIISKYLQINEDLILKILKEKLINYKEIHIRIMAETQIKNNKISPKNITHLLKNEVFVFGSNLSGIHGAGAARLAKDKFGAIYGQGEGLQGNAYALPTKDININTLKIEQIKEHVDKFIEVVKSNPNKLFLLTEVGCGLAGYKPRNIAPLFLNIMHLDNIRIPSTFYNILKNKI